MRKDIAPSSKRKSLTWSLELRQHVYVKVRVIEIAFSYLSVAL